MQKSFSIVEDNDVFATEDDAKDNSDKNMSYKVSLSESESEENSNSPKHTNAILSEFAKQNERSLPQAPNRELISSISSASFSGRQTVLRRKPAGDKKSIISSDSEDSDNEEKGKTIIPGEYDPKMYDNLDIDEETRELFQYILKYIPQQLNLDYKFKPFIPEFLPAVGDIDAFLKVVPPETTLTGEPFKDSLQLGLTVLDEPASNQSDPALLHLQLRATSVNLMRKDDAAVVVKKVENIEKNARIIEKWIKDISDLHKSKSSPVVRYSEPMPDLDDLMQEWPEEMETKLKENGFPQLGEDTSLSEYVTTVCNIFQIPTAKNKIQSIHLLFCLYAAIKQTQLYQSSTTAINNQKQSKQLPKKEADQLVLE
ncbi:intraflagellar transport protein 46 homolog [Anoplophora glabripennis]|uniref:intraflagellar transport protein 46 homolog n=1 Tax=Anoplophora glabripennis TaxID=217634 RepID=UPI000874D545|nr:intraflagellar transport protein 46 homolog [Anoplophora glabripennis]